MACAWSKGNYKHFAYYSYETRGCSHKCKSVARAKLRGGFEEILKRVQPSKRFLVLAIAMFSDAWSSRIGLAQAEPDEWRGHAEAAVRSVLELIDRMDETKNATAISAIETKSERLERRKIALVERHVAEFEPET